MSIELKLQQILFFGGGNMATAIISGLTKSVITSNNITVIDRNHDKLIYLKESFNININNNTEDLKNPPDIIIIAVKPVAVKSACKELNRIINQKTWR